MDRWLWPDIARIIRDVGPDLVFVENVPGLLSSGDGVAFGEVLGDLAELGLDAEWGVFSAAQTGTPHLEVELGAVRGEVADGAMSRRWATAEETDPPRPGSRHLLAREQVLLREAESAEMKAQRR